MDLARMVFVLSLSVLASLATEVPVAIECNSDRLYNDIIVGDYPSAVSLSSHLEKEQNGEIIRQVVKRLLSDSQRNTLEYAYQLWVNHLQDLVKEYFPVQFQMIVASDTITIINKRDGLAINVAVAEESSGDRLGFGDAHDTSSTRIAWRTYPDWDDNRVYFKIANVHRNQTLMLETSSDDAGDRRAFGSDVNNTNRHQWYLHPVYFKSELLFYIFNRQFDQALRLGRYVDREGDRILYGHIDNVLGSPAKFGWIIESYL